MQFKSPISLPAGEETQKCFYPLKLDTYGCGCSHNCLYCYAKTSLSFRGLWRENDASNASLADIKREFASFKNRYLRARLPVRLGGMTDCFGNNEHHNQVTRQVIEFSVCYDADDNYEAFRDLWANPADCCNCTGKVPGFTRKFDYFMKT